MKSVLQNNHECYICHNSFSLEEHHIFGGSNRKWSEKYGLKVYLCHNCHNEPPNGVHFNQELMEALHKIGQEKFEETHSRDEFMKLFGRNYL